MNSRSVSLTPLFKDASAFGISPSGNRSAMPLTQQRGKQTFPVGVASVPGRGDPESMLLHALGSELCDLHVACLEPCQLHHPGPEGGSI